MQINPSESLERQLQCFCGEDLENVVAATLALLGYTVFPNFEVEIEGETVCEIDVFASIQTPFHESRILFECKGNEPSFREITRFASVGRIVDPSPIRMIMVGRQGTRNSRKKLGKTLGVQITERQDLIRWILPLLRGLPDRPEQVAALNEWLIVFESIRYLVDHAKQNDLSKRYILYLTRHLWRIADPSDQVKDSFDKAQEEYSNTTKQVAEGLGLDVSQCLKKASHDVVEGAMYAELLHRIINMYAVTRSALKIQLELGREALFRCGPHLQKAINIISGNPRILFGFPRFFQYWIYVWGGVLRQDSQADEIGEMAKECCTTEEAVRSYFEIIEATYSSEHSEGMIHSGQHMKFFKYVPGCFRRLGFDHRHRKKILTSNEGLDRKSVV